MRRFGLALLASVAVAMPAYAQDVPDPPADASPDHSGADTGDDAAEDIVVTGSRARPGSVVGDIPPDQQLSPADIRSYGVSSVADLLAELSPQTASGRGSGRGSGGAPVVLLNGRRISGFAEIRDLPTEAIQRVEILPEEVALKYGYRADQKVVNFVLRRRFRAITAEGSARIPTGGGRAAGEVELDLLRIARDGRLTLHTEYNAASALTEAERGIVQTPGSADASGVRTLLPSTSSVAANAVYARPIFGDIAATLNGRIERTASNARQGFAANGIDAIRQDASSTTGHLGTSFNGDAGRWRWSLTGNYDRVESETSTDPASEARSTSSSGGIDSLASGPLFALPAGDATSSLRIGASTSDFASQSLRNGLAQTGNVARDIANGQVNLDLPIARASRDVLPFLGTLSLNGNLALDHLSDFGTLTTIGYGANWSPVEGVRLIASVTDEDEAPSAQQLGNPAITTPGVRVFDYIAGTTATVTTISGGNPLLTADNRHVEKLGLTLKPWTARELTLTANYVSSRTDDPISAFPTASAAIEAAFPNRFLRDAAGTLLRIDARPINYARTERSELRWGVNFSKPLQSKVQRELEAFRAGTGPNPFEGLRPPGGARPDRAEGERGPRTGGGGRFGGGRGQSGGRLNFALYHTWHFTDRVIVADGGPTLDLLNGDAIGGNGGQSRHEVEAQAGYTNNGLGARLSAEWRSGTTVRGGTAQAPEALDFSGLATANLRLFADLGQRLDLVKAHPWARGVRVTLSVDNILDTRQRVTDATGATPIGFQPGYLDPLGRTVRFSLRKLF